MINKLHTDDIVTTDLHTGALNAMLADCEDLLANMDGLSHDLADAIERDIDAKRAAKWADDQLAAAEAEIIAEVAIKTKLGDKESPLAGLAVTSKPYAAALDAVIAQERREGRLAALWADVQANRAAADDAAMLRERLAVRFSATKHAADLRAAMLGTYRA